MSQAFANPKSFDPPENNDPPKVETSKLISLFAKNSGLITLHKCHTDPSFINNDYLTSLFIRLKVPDLPFLKKVFLSHFLRFNFLKCPCGAHILATRK